MRIIVNLNSYHVFSPYGTHKQCQSSQSIGAIDCWWHHIICDHDCASAMMLTLFDMQDILLLSSDDNDQHARLLVFERIKNPIVCPMRL